MQGSDRIVFGRAFSVTPAWLWLIQRLSGLLLGPVVAAHMWIPDASMSPSLNLLLLLLVFGHGYSGIRRLAQVESKSRLMITYAWAWLLLVGAFGLLIVVYGE